MQHIVETHVLACAWHYIPTCPFYNNGQRDKALQWHATWLPVHALICAQDRGVSRNVNERECVEAAMLQCLQGNEAVADDGDILPFFGGPGAPLTSTAPSDQGTERHKANVVATVAPDGTPNSHAGNHDFITFRTGTQCATCKQVVRIWCNTCLVCHACFCASPRFCTEVVVNVADDFCDEGEDNSAEEWATPRK